nr:MAG TPA: hypothetical protein [Caudoviricetes sp.]
MNFIQGYPKLNNKKGSEIAPTYIVRYKSSGFLVLFLNVKCLHDLPTREHLQRCSLFLKVKYDNRRNYKSN